MRRRLYSTVFWAFMAASSLALFPGALVVWAATSPFDGRRVLLHRYTCFWASLYTWLNPAWPVTVLGREKIRDDQPCVMVANHLSLLDILVLFRLSFIGWNMTLNRYIPLRRGNRESVVRMMKACERTLAEGNSVMMFPEGTRSPTGELRAFKPGAFELALKTRVPIQPIVIHGTSQALPKRGFVLQGRHPIEIRVLDPIPYDAFAHLPAEELAAHVRGLIAEVLGEKQLTPAQPA